MSDCKPPLKVRGVEGSYETVQSGSFPLNINRARLTEPSRSSGKQVLQTTFHLNPYKTLGDNRCIFCVPPGSVTGNQGYLDQHQMVDFNGIY